MRDTGSRTTASSAERACAIMIVHAHLAAGYQSTTGSCGRTCAINFISHGQRGGHVKEKAGDTDAFPPLVR